MLKDNGIVPGKLPNGYVPVDIDVTPFDNSKTKKQGVSRTYNGCDGYAPIMAYIGIREIRGAVSETTIILVPFQSFPV